MRSQQKIYYMQKYKLYSDPILCHYYFTLRGYFKRNFCISLILENYAIFIVIYVYYTI